MASTTSLSSEDPHKSILEDGVFYAQDAVVGKRVNEIMRKGYPFKTEEGLDFCKRNVLDNKRIRNVLESYFDWSGLGFYKAFGPDPSRAFCFLNRINEDAKAQALVVQLWSSGSRIVFYNGLHLQSVHAEPAKNGLLNVPLDRLDPTDLYPIGVDMKDGGLAILDSRLGFTIVRGKVIMFGFATQEELAEWDKMHLPNVENLRRKVAQIESTTIGVNFDFVDGV